MTSPRIQALINSTPKARMAVRLQSDMEAINEELSRFGWGPWRLRVFNMTRHPKTGDIEYEVSACLTQDAVDLIRGIVNRHFSEAG